METKEAAVDNCPERMHVLDAEAPRPPRVKTAVEFWPRMKVESMEAAVLALEAAVDAL